MMLQRTGWIAVLVALAGAVMAADKPAGYDQRVLADQPVRYWRFEKAGKDDKPDFTVAGGGVVLHRDSGPRPAGDDAGYLDFDRDNLAVNFTGGGGRLVVSDPGAGSELDFTNGDEITIEAWVAPTAGVGSGHMYVIGKGRTYDAGFSRDNQNWAMRLTSEAGQLHVSLLFRDADDKSEDDWHRWTSEQAIAADGHWHHVAIAYRFGEPDSAIAYIDGQPASGQWDMGGPTTQAPIVDDAPVWLGSSMGGSNAFRGMIDEVAVYRKMLPAKTLAARYRFEAVPDRYAERATDDAVTVDIVEGVPARQWPQIMPQPATSYTQNTMAFTQIANKYNARGVIDDRGSAIIIRAYTRMTLPAGEYELLLRSLGAARLIIDGKQVAATKLPRTGGGAHENVPEIVEPPVIGMRYLQLGHSEATARFTSDGKEHLVLTEAMVGGKVRLEVGELSVSLRPVSEDDGNMYRLLTAGGKTGPAFTDAGWQQFADAEREHVLAVNTNLRRAAETEEVHYWQQRHAAAQRDLASEPAPVPPEIKSAEFVHNDIDRYINARLDEANVTPAGLIDDAGFLRRVTLDATGMIPSLAEIKRYDADPPAERRRLVIDRLLEDPRWADHWTAYWQDVLAENPGILKPMLNNTGPFRYFIYESFLDNKPIDRFATELIMMQGSRDYGGPAGFEMASQNDVPMAAKAHVLGRAFLGIDMTCARCHDAPFQDVDQRDLFEMAAMLKRSALTVPKSSSIPLSGAALRKLIVEVTLKPGESVAPNFPFGQLLAKGSDEAIDKLIRNTNDPRDRLAAIITSHDNRRFAQVVANRVWRRYIGFGIVEPVQDWDGRKPSHPELLNYLARELMVSGYDLKHLARLIFNSHTYQRAIDGQRAAPAGEFKHLFAAPARRRMTAEQIVDSMHAIAGKSMGCEKLTMDLDNRLPANTFLDFGYPTRSWQFVSLSNERDRPSLAKPMAQTIITTLTAFGWRESRQDPLDVRDPTPVVQQPAVLANGLLTQRIVALSDDSALTRLAIEAESPGALVEALYLRVLTRKPSPAERDAAVKLLAEGFDSRLRQVKPATGPVKAELPFMVSWSNHLSPEANELKLAYERRVEAGDPPTGRLAPAWRQRVEDLAWAMINSPEMVFVP